jgi:hypothetical protein
MGDRSGFISELRCKNVGHNYHCFVVVFDAVSTSAARATSRSAS